MFFIVLFNSPCIHLYSGEGPFLPNSGYKTRYRLGLNHTGSLDSENPTAAKSASCTCDRWRRI